ncbi:MAG: diguanylate cyclase domain-containing protein, partial [Burkholderiaceae bacterium]
MEFPGKHASAFTRSLWLTVISFILLSIAFAGYVQSERLIDQAHENRTQSLLLAVQLQQSSEQLMHAARAFVVTSLPRYRKKYEEIIAIQNGNMPRPADFYRMYGDLPLSDDAKAQASQLPPISILALAQQLGVTKEEYQKLEQAKDKSDELTAIEYAAMDMVALSDAPFNVSHLKAREMLFDKTYIQLRDEILQPISEFYRMVDRRTMTMIQAQMEDARRTRFAFILFGLLLLFALWRTYRNLHATLGGSLDELHSRIVRIGQGEFSTDLQLRSAWRDNSVLAWLMETQKNLAQMYAQKKDAEAQSHRLTRLYQALGQCNEAIIRCKDEEQLFGQICKNVVDVGGMDMAWVGVLDAPSRRIRPHATHGAGAGYAQEIQVSIDEKEAIGNGMAAVSFREDRLVWYQDFQNEPGMAPWWEAARRFGWRSCAAIPLHSNGKVCGTLCVYSTMLNAFDEAVRELLSKLAVDIDYALSQLESNRQRNQALDALTSSRRMLRTIIDSTPVRIFWKNLELRYIGCNRAFVEDTALGTPKEIIGKDDYELVWHDYAERYRAIDREVIKTGVPRLSYEEEICTAFGKKRWVRTSKVPLFDETGQMFGVLGMYEDITEQKRTAEHVQYLANYDTLTGLPSRASLNERLEYALHMISRGDRSLTLMLLDLDNFKDINDALGHSVGDAVLVELAGRLRGVVRPEDTVAHFGGDEFVLLRPDTDERGATFFAQRLLDALAKPCRIDHYNLSLAASIGIAIAPRDGTDIDTLFRSADTAMYQAKKEGRRAYRFATPAMQERSARNLQLVSAMNEALAHDQFQICFQPQICIRDERLVGMEALLRWHHPQFGVIPPFEFMPVAEDSGLILSVGEKVMRKAVRQAKAWMNEEFGPLTVGVNLSVAQFRDPALPELIARILDEEGLQPEYLDLELTESVAMSNPERAIAMMHELHERGVQISIDDFGTG